MNGETPPPIPGQPRGNWWTRNWKWFVPAGCLTMLVLAAAFAAAIGIVVFSAVKSTNVYKEALAKAKANPAVVEALGTPIRDGMLVSGNSSVSGPTGESNLTIPISGPKGNGTIYVKAVKSLGRWEFVDLVVEVKTTGARIDLLQHTRPEP